MNHKEFAEGYLLHKIPFGIVEALGLDRHPWLVLPTMLVACSRSRLCRGISSSSHSWG